MAATASNEEPGGCLRFECGICLKQFSTAWILQIHIRTHDEERSFDCHECGMTFHNFAELWEHTKQHVVGEELVPTEENNEVCSVCEKEYPVSQITMHQRSHVFKPGLTCTTCGKSFGSSQVLKLHLRTHGKKTLYHCQICGLKFASRNSFTIHWNSHGTNDSPDSHSMIHKTKRKRETSKHAKGRSPPGNMISGHKKSNSCYKCNICSKILSSPSKLGIHRLCHQSQTDQKRQKDHTASVLTHETGHEITERNQLGKSPENRGPPFLGFVKKLGKNFLCSVCNKVYKNRTKAERHAKYHYYQERQKTCTQKLNEHFEVRRRGRSSLPDDPGEVGSKQTTETQHTRIQEEKAQNLSENTLTCSECDKTFNKVDDLQQHKQLHIKECTLALMRMLSPKENMNLTLESETFLDAVKSAAKLTDKEEKEQIKVKKKTKSYLQETVPVVDSEDCDLNTDDENDALEMEHVGEEHQNESFVSLPDIFVSPDRSQGKRTNNISMVSTENFSSDKDPCSLDVHQHTVKDNKIICKVCSREFSSIEQVSLHIKSHLKKDDTVFQLRDFHELHEMINVKVVLERLDIHKLGISSRKGRVHLGRIHSQNIPTTLKDKTLDLVSVAHSAVFKGDSTLASEDISLASKYPTFGCTSEKDNETQYSSLADFNILEEFEDNSSSSDAQDEDWTPSNTIRPDSWKRKLKTIKAEFDSSDCETSVNADDQANAVAAAIAACDVDPNDNHEDLSTYVQATDRGSNKRRKMEGNADFAHSDASNVSDAESSYNVPETHQGSVSNTAVVISSTVTSLVADDAETEKEVMSHCIKIGDVYICKMCSREYDCKVGICNHIANHLREKTFKCNFCGHSFDRKAMLDLHLGSHEKQHALVGGVTDQDVRTIRESFYEHEGVYRCKTCVCYYRLRSDAYRHALTHLFPRIKEDKSEKSGTTSKSFTLGDVSKLIVKEDGWFKCLKCSKKLKERSGAQAHVKRHLFEPTFKCNQCLYATYSKHHLQRHYKSHPVSCPERGKQCIDISTDHKTKRTYERFKMEDAMKYLFKEGERYRCIECDTVINTEKAAHVHVKRHFRDPLFRCTMCSYAAYTKHHLVRHIKTHKRMKKMNEDLIELPTESFTSKDAEKYIVKEKEKFKCIICDSMISNESNAKMHVKRHLKSAKYKCPHCEYRNHSRHHIRRHMKTHGKRASGHPVESSCTVGNDSKDSEATCPDGIANGGKGEASGTFAKAFETCKAGESGHGAESSGLMISSNISNHELLKEAKENICKLGSNFQCKICSKKYATKRKIYNHVVSHLKKKHHKCEYCGHEFTDMNLLIKHELRHLKQHKMVKGVADGNIPSIKDKFVVRNRISYCLICNSNFKTRTGAYKHVLDHLTFEQNRVGVIDPSCTQTDTTSHMPETKGNNESFNTAEKNTVSHDVSHNWQQILDGKKAYKDAVLSNSIEDIMVVDNSTCVITEQEITERMNSDHPCEGKIGNTTFDIEVGPSADSEKLNDSTVSDTSNYKLRLRLSAPISGKYSVDLSSDEETDMEENDTEYERDNGNNCESETDESEQENVTVKTAVADSSFVTIEPNGVDQNHTDMNKSENLKATDTRMGQNATDNEEHGSGNGKKGSHLHGNIVKVGDKYRCKICRKEFALKVKCYSHVTYHFKKKKYVCEDCGYSTVSRSYLLVHMGKHKKKMVEFPCKICHHVFPKSKFLTRHVALHSDEDKVKYLNYLECDTCGTVCRTIKVLYRHKLQHLESFQCKCCDVILPSAVAFENHAYEMKHFYCEKCGKSYSDLKSLENHQKGVHEYAGNFSCGRCAKTFITRTAFKHHLQTHEVKYECKGCKAKFKTLKELKDHKHVPRSEVKQVVNEISEYTHCELCGRSFKTPCNLESHKLLHQALEAIGEDIKDGTALTNITPSQTLACPVCLRKYPSVFKLNEHVRIHTDIKKYKNSKHVPGIEEVGTTSEYLCELCCRTFKTQSRLECHKLIHQALSEIGEDVQDGSVLINVKLTQNISCPVCRKQYYSVFKLNDHVRVHTDVRKYKCDVCGLAFANKAYFMTHQNIHNNIRPFPCDECHRAFPSENFLKNHKKQSHRKEERVVKIVTCDICGKKLTSHSLSSHKQLHDKEKHVKKFPCDLCGKKFYSEQQVKAHNKNVHTNESVHMCDICGKFLKSKYILKEHEKIHTGERPFQCNECGNTFKTREALKRHFVVHSGEKAYTCEFCGKAFGLPETLSNHRNIHTGAKPYKCGICGMKFGDRWARHNHVKRHKLQD